MKRKRDNKKSVSIVINIQPLSVKITHNINHSVEAHQQITINGICEDPDLKSKFGNNLVTSWSCTVNGEQSCSNIFTDITMRNNQ